MEKIRVQLFVPVAGFFRFSLRAGIFMAVLFSLFWLKPTQSYAATSCGDSGQRACCVTERIPSCNSGMHEVLGCYGDCTCGGANPFGALKSAGRCVPNPVITVCGGAGQRACCVTERVPSCNPGTHEVLGCSGSDCTCGGANPGWALKSLGRCQTNPVVTACGGTGQRACCVTERVPSCNPGTHEVLGCSGSDCTCGGANPGWALKSLGRCQTNPVVTACGGAGQRACCVTERVPSCNPGTHEKLGCSGSDCICGGANPGWTLKSLGRCQTNPVISACGGIGQRACCVTERVPSCNPGSIEAPGCSTGNCICGGANPGWALKSIGHCVSLTAPAPNPTTACGGAGQRACCVTERVPSCNTGLIEIPGCATGNCTCGGPNPLGVLKSIGHCEGGCLPAKNALALLEARRAQLEAELKKLNIDVNAARNFVNQQCGQAGGAATAPAPQPLQRTIPQQLKQIPLQQRSL